MFDAENFKSELFFTTEKDFEDKALRLFTYQWHNNPVYRTYSDQLGKTPNTVQSLQEIPFLPIEFFKSHSVKTGNWKPQKHFLSSGTTGTQRSRHLIEDLAFYHKNAEQIFESVFGPIEQYQLIALLPSYLEQEDSSLISMIESFIRKSAKPSGFEQHPDKILQLLNASGSKKIVFGVSYALLDLALRHTNGSVFSDVVIIETGGMKGRKKEITRQELHLNLKKGLNVKEICSEYGMTELLSQAYGRNGEFAFPSWCKLRIRDINDPFQYLETGSTGGINIIDLANVSTCAFVETKDLGKVLKNGYFEVLGRFDHSDMRGCNLLI